MSIRKLFSMIFGMMVLSAFVVPASAQTTDQAARDEALKVVRSELRSTVNFKSNQFLGVRRDEELEQSLAVATVGWRSGPVFIYKVSPTGIEIRENTIVDHVATDADFLYIVAVRSVDGSTYRIHGFGLAESVAGFEKLMTALRVRVASPDQAESFADFYRKVNPGNQETLAPISSLIELKQSAERQCQTSSFDAGEKAFDTWWKHAKPLYAKMPFRQTVIPRGSGYLVEWVILSSAAPSGNCGGAPLRAQLEVGSDGHVGKVTFTPLQKGKGPTVTTR